MVTKEKRKEYRQNFIDKIGIESFKLYVAKQHRNYSLKNSKKKAIANKAWREKNPDYNRNYYQKCTKGRN